MARDRRPAEELSIEELEALLARKKREAREVRVQRFRESGRALRLAPDPLPASMLDEAGEASPFQAGPETAKPQESGRTRSAFNGLLLAVEVGAVIGLGYLVLTAFGVLNRLNQESAQAMAGPTPSATPLITAVVLPSGHTPPTSPGGPAPNEEEIPANLRPLVQSLADVPIPTPGPGQARNIFIPALWNDAAPVVQGDGWEQLKKGVGQHIGSPNPGQKGNVVLSAHNDIFGELFRYLDRLKPGDEVQLWTTTQTGTRIYVYRVTGIRIVQPTDVSVMAPTERPTLTLVSCYPYMVDKQRIVVFAELAEG